MLRGSCGIYKAGRLQAEGYLIREHTSTCQGTETSGGYLGGHGGSMQMWLLPWPIAHYTSFEQPRFEQRLLTSFSHSRFLTCLCE